MTNLHSILELDPPELSSFISKYIRPNQFLETISKMDSRDAAVLLFRYHKDSLMYLRSDSVLHTIVRYLLDPQSLSQTCPSRFTRAIDFFYRYEDDDTISDDQFTSLTDWLAQSLTTLLRARGNNLGLILAGIVTDGPLFEPPTELEHLINDDPITAIFSCAFLAARVASCDAMAGRFLDFFTNSISGPAFLREFPCVPQSAILERSVWHVKMAASREISSLIGNLPYALEASYDTIVAYVVEVSDFNLFAMLPPAILARFSPHIDFFRPYLETATPASVGKFLSIGIFERAVYEMIGGVSTVNPERAQSFLKVIEWKPLAAEVILRSIPRVTELTRQRVECAEFIKAVIKPFPHVLYRSNNPERNSG
jgi:hypothetical protein